MSASSTSGATLPPVNRRAPTYDGRVAGRVAGARRRVARDVRADAGDEGGYPGAAARVGVTIATAVGDESMTGVTADRVMDPVTEACDIAAIAAGAGRLQTETWAAQPVKCPLQAGR